MRRVVAVMMTLAFAPWSAAAAADGPPWTTAATASVDAAVADMMDRQHVRGMSVTVARGGAVLFAKGYGLRDVAAEAPVTPATIFLIGSNTKTFTAAAIGQLIDRGALRLEARVSDVLPNVPHATEITVEQLLHHSSGLPDYVDEPGFETLATLERPSTTLLLALLGSQPLLFPPGSRFAYSNTNYLVLGAIVETLTGMPYERYITDRIAVPAGATTVSYGLPATGDVALGYDTPLETPVKPWAPESLRAAGALAASPRDLVRFDEAFFEGRIVSPRTVTLLTTPPVLTPPEVTTYAGGWIAGTLYGHRMIWHNGGVPGANTRNVVFPDDHVEIVILTNRLTADETPVLRAAWRALVPPSSAHVAAQRNADEAPAPNEDGTITAIARRELEGWESGAIDPTHYAYVTRLGFSEKTIANVKEQLGHLGAPLILRYAGRTITNRQTLYAYRLSGSHSAIMYVLGFEPGGTIRTVLFTPAPPAP